MNFDIYTIALRAVVLILTIPVHEAAHAWAAHKMGDNTAKYQGRLTLDPMKHFDLLGSISLVFLGIGWAKPVPVNPNNFKNRKKGMALSAAAGPISNLILAFISLMIFKIFFYLNLANPNNSFLPILSDLFSYMTSINITLAVFNLMPFPPFDGSRILGYFLPDKLYWKFMQNERTIFYIVLALVWLGFFNTPLAFFSSTVIDLFDNITFFIDDIARSILF